MDGIAKTCNKLPGYLGPVRQPFPTGQILLREEGTSSSRSYLITRGKPPTWLPRGGLLEEERQQGKEKVKDIATEKEREDHNSQGGGITKNNNDGRKGR